MGYWMATISGTAVITSVREAGYVIRVGGIDMAWCPGTSLGAVGFSSPSAVQFSYDPRSSSASIEPDGARLSDYTISADYIEDTFTITCKAGTGGTLKASKSKASAGTQITLTPTPDAGYQFSSYTKSPSSLSISNNKFTMPSQNVTITANFTKINYTLTKAGNPAAGGIATTSKATAQVGDTITVGNTPNAGYSFKSYSSSPKVTISNNKFTMPASNVTITANFNHVLYNITKNVVGDGSFTAKKSGTEVTTAYYQDSIALVATAGTGYRFKKWTVSGGTIGSATSASTTLTMPNGNVTITAEFEKIPRTITLNSSPSDGGSVSTDHGTTATYGDVVTLSNSPNNGYLFTEYQSNDVTISNGKFTMPNGDVSITAIFHIGRSTCELDDSSYTGGDTAVLSIAAEKSSFTHRYRLNFGPGMDTGFVNVAAGISSVDIYIPVEWATNLMDSDISGSTHQRTGGVLTLETYNGSTLFGTYQITDLVYVALDNIVPRLILKRAKESGAYKFDGERATFSIEAPEGAMRLICGDTVISDPESSGFVMPGNKKQIPPGESLIVTLEITIGNETFSVTESVPSVAIVVKNIETT